MKLYGIASSVSRDVNDFYATREEAEAVLEQIHADEPELAGVLWVEAVEVGDGAFAGAITWCRVGTSRRTKRPL